MTTVLDALSSGNDSAHKHPLTKEYRTLLKDITISETIRVLMERKFVKLTFTRYIQRIEIGYNETRRLTIE